MADDKTIELDPLKEVATFGNILEMIKRAAAAQGIATATAPTQLKIAVTQSEGKVAINFGQPVQIMTLELTQATKLAASIMSVVQSAMNPEEDPEDTKEVDKPE